MIPVSIADCQEKINTRPDLIFAFDTSLRESYPGIQEEIVECYFTFVILITSIYYF